MWFKRRAKGKHISVSFRTDSRGCVSLFWHKRTHSTLTLWRDPTQKTHFFTKKKHAHFVLVKKWLHRYSTSCFSVYLPSRSGDSGDSADLALQPRGNGQCLKLNPTHSSTSQTYYCFRPFSVPSSLVSLSWPHEIISRQALFCIANSCFVGFMAPIFKAP